MRKRLAPLAVVPLFLIAGAACAEVRVYFSPQDRCEKMLTEVARGAHDHLEAACYSLTLDSIANELVAANRRGVKVRVILDRSQCGQPLTQAAKLLAAGISARVNSHGGEMRHNFLVADGKNVACGSFAWTRAAVEKNEESLVVFLDEVAVAGAFAAQFENMWNDANRFMPLSVIGGAAGAPVTQQAPDLSAGGGTVYVTKTGRKYHRAGCRHLAKSSIPISRKDAIARGYTPCKVCKP